MALIENYKYFPAKFIERYESIIPDFDDFLKSLLKPLPKAFRINTLKATKEEVLSKLSSLNIKPIPWFDLGFWLVDNTVNLGAHIIHQQGLIYLQESASMIPPIVLAPKPNEQILDMASAPGSKTTQIAQMMANTGLIVANDISISRLKALIYNIERLGVLNTVVICQTGQSLGYLVPNYFDRVLLDAPCSLEGIIASTPQALSKWTESSIKRLSKLQKGLINSAFKCLKPNGTLVYSTCTFAPEENEEVIDYLLSNNHNAVCEPIFVANLKTRPAITKWGKNIFNEQVKNCIRIYPQDNNCEGFFIAKISKIE